MLRHSVRSAANLTDFPHMREERFKIVRDIINRYFVTVVITGGTVERVLLPF